MATDLNAKLLRAASTGDVNLLQYALANGADVNTKNTKGTTALIMASSSEGHMEMVRTLIAAGADMNLRNKWGSTALIWASYEGHTESARALIAAGADITLQDNRGCTALRWANDRGHTDIVDLLENATKGIRPSRKEAGLPSVAEQAKAARQWREAEKVRANLRAGKTDPGEVGF